MPAKRRLFEVVECDCREKRPHGIPHGYNVHKCGCDPCFESYGRYRKQREFYESVFVDAGPLRDRLLVLRERGLGTRAVAEQLGLSSAVLFRVARGEQPRVKRETRDSVYTLRLPPA